MTLSLRGHVPVWLLQAGKDNRQVGATLMNQDSSRSHSIFTITIECIEKLESAAAQKPGAC